MCAKKLIQQLRQSLVRPEQSSVRRMARERHQRTRRPCTLIVVSSSRTNDNQRASRVRVQSPARFRSTVARAYGAIPVRARSNRSPACRRSAPGHGGALRAGPGAGAAADCATATPERRWSTKANGRREPDCASPSSGHSLPFNVGRQRSVPVGRSPPPPSTGHTSIHTRGHVRPHPSRPQPFFSIPHPDSNPSPPLLTSSSLNAHRYPTPRAADAAIVGVKRVGVYACICINVYMYVFLLRFAGSATDFPRPVPPPDRHMIFRGITLPSPSVALA